MSVTKLVRIRTGIINIPTKVGEKSWRECWTEMESRSDFFGVNEILSRAQRRVYRELSHEFNFGRQGVGSPNAIFWNKEEFTKLSGRVIKIHDKATGVFARRAPGFNAARYMTEVVLEASGGSRYSGPNGRKQEYAVLCSHWVPQQRVSPIFRAKSRRASKKKLRELVAKHRAAGRVVVFLADTNIYKPIHIGPMLWMRKKGIDKMGIAVPEGVDVTGIDFVRFRAPTDHKYGNAGHATVHTK